MLADLKSDQQKRLNKAVDDFEKLDGEELKRDLQPISEQSREYSESGGASSIQSFRSNQNPSIQNADLNQPDHDYSEESKGLDYSHSDKSRPRSCDSIADRSQEEMYPKQHVSLGRQSAAAHE